MIINDADGKKISPATEEKQDQIIALMGGGTGAVVQVRLTRPVEGSPVQYTANDAINSSVANPVSVNVPNFALAAGRAAYIMAIQATTNMLNLADGIIRLWLYRTEPSGLVGDNVAMTNDDANTTKGRHYIDIKFNSLLANSTTILGIKEPVALYITDPASADLKLRVQTLTAFTPVSAGWIDIAFTLLQL